jgi:hypothetical protein
MPSTLPPSSTTISSSSTAPTTDDPTTTNTASDPHHKPKYVVSPSGHAAHPDEILASCRALHAHVAQLQAQAEKDLAELTERIKARELAEKRRVAPGWLDSEARLLEPERTGGVVAGAGAWVPGSGTRGGSGSGSGSGAQQEMLLQQPVQGHGVDGVGYGNGYGHGPGGASEMAVPDEGEELDRAFGGLQVGKP